jgi:hypothetical protein
VDGSDHIGLFNAAVVSGDWGAFVGHFSADAVMEFIGPSIGPFVGRAAIADAYATSPPDDTIEPDGPVASEGDDLIVPFRWSSTRDRGVLRITQRSGQIERMVVSFE